MGAYFHRQGEEVVERLLLHGGQAEAAFAGRSRRTVEAMIAKAGVPKGINIDKAQEAERLKQMMTPPMLVMSSDAGQEFLENFGLSFNVNDPAVLSWLGGRMDLFSREVSGTTFDEIKVILRDGFTEGKPLSTIADILRNKFGEYEKYRAPLIARTEVNAGMNMADLMAIRQAGIGDKLKKTWLSARDKAVRPSHVEAEKRYGKGIPVEEPFQVGADSMLTPGTGTDPAENINCRCTPIYQKTEGAQKPIVPRKRKPKVPGVPAVPAPALTPRPQPKPTPAGPGPKGEPVSGALEVQAGGKTKKAVEDVIGKIDSLHGDGKLPKIPVVSNRSNTFGGQYRYYSFTGKPADIRISSMNEVGEIKLSSAHEIGHFIDHQGIGQVTGHGAGRYASMGDPAMSEFRTAVRKTKAYQQILHYRQQGGSLVEVPTEAGSMMQVRVSSRHINYLAGWHETWARAYSQYVAEKTGSTDMLAAVARRMKHPIYGGQLWDSEDFKPVAEAIENLLKKLGWMT